MQIKVKNIEIKNAVNYIHYNNSDIRLIQILDINRSVYTSLWSLVLHD